ncbi:MAG: glutaredoxin family protein [Planctomycetes bacterium]|nr:glutaredoxin family protein [Planctomycetota bacterium]
MPRSWHQNDWLWWLVGLFSAGIGGHLLVRSEVLDTAVETWKPTVPGRRFRDLILYTRAGCHLCDEAAETLQEHARWLPPVNSVDIDSDPRLVEQFGTCVPVLALDGKIRFRGKVDATLLRRLIEGTPPIPIADL